MDQNEMLLRLRKEKGLSQAELAEELGISRQTVSRWEAGIALPSSENLIGLSHVYGIPAEDLYRRFDQAETEGGEEETKPGPELTEPPAGGGEEETGRAEKPENGGKASKKPLLIWLAATVLIYGAVLLWGWLDNSWLMAATLLEFFTILQVLGWVLHGLYIIVRYIKRKDVKK